MARSIYRIQFVNQGQVYELYATEVAQSGMMGFVEVGGFLFGEKSAIVVDPAEERLKNEFAGVERSYIPMHAVIRIDQVEKQGVARIVPSEGAAVMPFPGTWGGSGKGGDGK